MKNLSNSNNEILGYNSGSLFVLDPRSQGVVFEKTYKNNPMFTSLDVTDDDKIVTASMDGIVRLYDGMKNIDGGLKQAKNNIQITREPILHITVSPDKKWILGSLNISKYSSNAFKSSRFKSN